MCFFTSRQAPQMVQNRLAPRQTAPADLPGDTRSQNLLGPASANSERLFKHKPVYPGLGKITQALGDFL
jgi:hypothetical protein